MSFASRLLVKQPDNKPLSPTKVVPQSLVLYRAAGPGPRLSHTCKLLTREAQRIIQSESGGLRSRVALVRGQEGTGVPAQGEREIICSSAASLFRGGFGCGTMPVHTREGRASVLSLLIRVLIPSRNTPQTHPRQCLTGCLGLLAESG